LIAAKARADQDNDLQLWRLGHPDALGCTICTGAPGDVPEPGDFGAQKRFHQLASTVGLAFLPQFGEPAGSLGQAGFEITAGSSQAFLRIPGDAWATPRIGNPPGVLVLPAVALRKGLGGSVDLGVSASWLSQSQMFAVSGELRWAPLDGLASAPDVAIRVYGTRVLGTRELDLTMAGADASISRTFPLAGMLRLQPYGQIGVALINATSGAVDMKPAQEDPDNPTADDGTFRAIHLWDNRYLRAAVGVRLITGVFLAGLEASWAQGTNVVQSDAVAGGTPEQTVRLVGMSARVGFTF
jgi:hypothetical protein